MTGWPPLEDFYWHDDPDVLVISAARTLGSVLKKLNNASAEWIVLVRQHPESGETYYYAFRREEFDDFITDDPELLATPTALAVEMHEWTSSGVTRNRRPAAEWSGASGPAALRTVDIDVEGRVRGIGDLAGTGANGGSSDRWDADDLLGELGEARGGHTGTVGVGHGTGTDEAGTVLEGGTDLLDELGEQRGGTRGGDTGPVGAGRQPATDEIRITLSADTEAEIDLDQQKMVFFKLELTSEARPLAHSTEAAARKDEDIVVSLSVENDRIECLTAEPQTVPPPGPGSARTGFFEIRAVQAGPCRLAVRFRQGGTDLAVIPLTVEVVEHGADGHKASGEAPAAPRDPEDDDKLALTVEQRSDGGQVFYEYVLFSEPFDFHGRKFHSQPLKDRGDGPAATIQAYVKRMYEQVTRKLGGDVQTDLKRLQREVLALGVNLCNELFEPDVVRALWPLRDRIDLIQIISWEPYIPWELVRLKHPDTGEIDDRFLAEYGLIRTLADTSPPRTLPLGTWRYHGARFPSGAFPPVGRELDYFTGTGSGTLQARSITPEALEEGEDAFYDTVAAGDFDVLHLACHAEGDEDEIDRAHLIIGEATEPSGSTRAIAVGPSILQAEANWQARHPLIFLNACETGRAGAMLTAWGGWPNVFLRCGAGAFIGSAWAVRDGPAARFATAFYEALLDGSTLAAAATAARQAARKSASGTELDASWLAFKVYGHPRAQAQRH